MPITPGQTIGPYRILEKIGEGGMGSVFKAEQASVHRLVVIKVLAANVADDPAMLDRFKRELDIIAQLEHPHILPVYDFGEAEGSPYIVMRYMGGGSLLDQLQSRTLSHEQILRCFEQIAAALDYAHDRNVIHRDLKPANILLDERGNAYLADFGLAKTLGGVADLTKTGSILGTPAYMSPEQARGEKLDARSDVYSLGIMVYQALTGQQPFSGKTPWELISKQLTEPPPLLTTINPDLPLAAEEAVSAALVKDREQRPARASIFVKSLRAALSSADAAINPIPQLTAQSSTQANLAGATGARTLATASLGSARSTTLALPRSAAIAIPAALAAILIGVVAIAAVIGLALFIFRDQLFKPASAVYAVGDSPRAIVYDGKTMWVANGFGDSLTQLQATGCAQSADPCGQSLNTYRVDTLPIGLAFDGRSLWTASAINLTLTQIDPQTGQAVGQFYLPNVPSSLIYAHGSLWTANQFANTVSKIGTDGLLNGDYSVGENSGPLALVADRNSIWVANQKGRTLAQLDPETGAITATIQLDGEPDALAFDGVYLWAALGDKDEVVKVDLTASSIASRVSVGKQPVALLFDGKMLWAANALDHTVTRIDPATAKVVTTLTVSDAPYALAWAPCGDGCGDLWVVIEKNDTVVRVRVDE